MKITIDYNGSVLKCKVKIGNSEYDSIASLSPLNRAMVTNALKLALKGYEQDMRLKKLGFKDKV